MTDSYGRRVTTIDSLAGTHEGNKTSFPGARNFKKDVSKGTGSHAVCFLLCLLLFFVLLLFSVHRRQNILSS